MARDTSLTGFADVHEIATKEQEEKAHIRTKGTKEVRHSQLRFYNEDNWRRAHCFAREQGISLNQLAILGIHKLMLDKGLPGLNLETEGGWRRSS